jgi:hypothetical protein
MFERPKMDSNQNDYYPNFQASFVQQPYINTCLLSVDLSVEPICLSLFISLRVSAFINVWEVLRLTFEL